MYDDLYCKIFIDTKLVYDELFSIVLEHVNGKKESFSYIVTDWCDMFVQKNKEYSDEQYLKDSRDFIYWKYYIDVEPIEMNESTYIEGIKDFLNFLKQYCNGVVAACDFESELNM